MNKLSAITQELVNSFPEWTRVRTDKQSIGYQLLNAIANPMEKIEFELNKLEKNVHLSTVNLHEPNLIYKVDASEFTFTEKIQNGVYIGYDAPTVTANSTAIPVRNIEDGSLESFWAKTDPDRISSSTSFQGTPISTTNALELYIPNTLYPLTHHIEGGGRFYFDLDVEHPYLKLEDQKFKRARIRISGETAKGIKDSEVIIFPWKTLTQSVKEWKYIDAIEIYDASGGNETLSVYSELVQENEYLSLSNLRTSVTRNKIDEFWGILNSGSKAYLERVEYVTDRFQTLINGTVDKFTKARWVLKNTSGTNIASITDMTLIPYKDKFWAVDATKLYLFSLEIENYENFDKLAQKDSNVEISIVTVTEDIVTGEDFLFKVWHERNFNLIKKIQVWYVKPDDTSVYLTNSGVVGFEEYTTTGTSRTLFNTQFTVTAEGEYLINASVEYEDGTIETDSRLFKNNTKQALKEFTISGIIASGETVQGIYYDANQRLLLKTTNYYYQIDEHKDIMLIDYYRKVIYLHEKYTDIAVNYP